MDADGREIFRAASEWMILDKHSSRPKNLQRLRPASAPGRPQGPELPSSIRLRPAEVYTPAGTLSVPFSSLDFNGHVNNTEYVRWALDGLHHRLGRVPATRSMQVTYTAEVFEGDQIEVLVAADSDAPVRILERRAGGAAGDNVFLMELEGYEKGCEL